MRIADDVTSWGIFPLKIGSATAERVGRGEVGGVTRRVKMVPSKPWAACEAQRSEPTCRRPHAVFLA